MIPFTESEIEGAAPGWLQGLGSTVAHGPEIATGHSCKREYRTVSI